MTKEIDTLGVLEEKITQLVEAYASLKTEKTALAEKMGQNGFRFISRLTWTEVLKKLLIFKP